MTKLLAALLIVSFIINLVGVTAVIQDEKGTVQYRPTEVDLYYNSKLVCSGEFCYPIEDNYHTKAADCFNNQVCFKFHTQDVETN